MNRRIGYAEKEGLAVLKKQRAKQLKKEAIILSIIGAGAVAFFCWAAWMCMSGYVG